MVVMGRVTAPFGVKGWVKIEPYTESPESLKSFAAPVEARQLPMEPSAPLPPGETILR